jgi:hypothetical protein
MQATRTMCSPVTAATMASSGRGKALVGAPSREWEPALLQELSGLEVGVAKSRARGQRPVRLA